MTHPAYLREKARHLRLSKQLTIDEIAERLALPRTTIFYWVRDMPIAPSGRAGGFSTAAQRKGSRAMQAKYALLRAEAYEDGVTMFAGLLEEPTFRDFLCLYMAEGSKRGRNEVEICNSDPEIMKLTHRWMSRFASNPLDYRIQYHVDQDLQALRDFWGEVLAIDPGVIRVQRKSNSNHLTGRSWRSNHGVLTVRVSDTYFKARLQAWIDCLRRTWV